jgi:hypothetical protein
LIGYKHTDIGDGEYAHKMNKPSEEEEIGIGFEAALVEDIVMIQTA